MMGSHWSARLGQIYAEDTAIPVVVLGRIQAARRHAAVLHRALLPLSGLGLTPG